jgi:large subunit ribosomal protein L10
LNREQKAAVVEQVAGEIKSSDAVFAVDYRGMTVTQAADLRGRLRAADAALRVVKNTLTERAADQAGAESLKELLEGPTALTFVRGDVAVAAKAIATFRREHEIPQFKGGTMGGEPVTVEQLESIARLPAREQLQAQFVGVLASPITGLVRGLASMIGGLASQLGQIRDQGLVTGGTGEPEAPAAEAEAPTPAEPEEAPAAEAEAPAEEAPAEEAPAEEAPAEEAPAAAADGPAEEAPAAEAEAEPAEAPGDPVAEAEAAEEETSETPSEGDTEQEG